MNIVLLMLLLLMLILMILLLVLVLVVMLPLTRHDVILVELLHLLLARKAHVAPAAPAIAAVSAMQLVTAARPKAGLPACSQHRTFPGTDDTAAAVAVMKAVTASEASSSM